MQEVMIKRAKELLADGTATKVLGWKRGEFAYDITPAVFETAEEIERDFVYDDFTAANVSKYLMKETAKGEGKVLAFLKPCDTYSFNQLVTEHRIKREKTYIIGIPCEGKADVEKIKAAGTVGITGITAEGDNEHHKIEGSFKALARAIRMAVARDVRHLVLPSSKGTL